MSESGSRRGPAGLLFFGGLSAPWFLCFDITAAVAPSFALFLAPGILCPPLSTDGDTDMFFLLLLVLSVAFFIGAIYYVHLCLPTETRTNIFSPLIGDFSLVLTFLDFIFYHIFAFQIIWDLFVDYLNDLLTTD